MTRSKSRTRVFRVAAAAVILGGMVPVTGFAVENMIGRQSQNEGIRVLPVPGPVTIDGDLADWDWSGRIQVFCEYTLRDRFSTEAAAMWDKDALYVAVKWRDPTPMNGRIDPKLNPGDGWKADAAQFPGANGVVELSPPRVPRQARRSRPAAAEAPASLPRGVCAESQAQAGRHGTRHWEHR